jgi:AAHS family 4-hydroxybenzoate transporter-like MFS transporter
MPNIIALTSEYTPTRLRATLITLMFCGFPLGSTLGGLLATYLVPTWGWRSVFWLGGALPLVLLGALITLLPESVYYLIARGRSAVGVARLLQRIAPAQPLSGSERFVTAQQDGQKGFPVRLLFTRERRPITLLLWAAFFMNLLVMYFLVNWLPALFSRAGLPVRAAIISTSILNLGGVVGAIVLGRVIDRVAAHRVLGAAYAAAACFIVLIAFAGTDLRVLVPSLFFTGFGVVGAQIGMNALTAAMYPTAIRSTGVGWALGVGRIGSIVGPTLGGWLLALGWAPGSLFALAAAPAFLAAISVGVLGILHAHPSRR